MHKKKIKPFKIDHDGVTIEANYSLTSKEKELIRFSKNGIKFEISSDSLLGLITNQFKKKSFALTLADSDMIEIPMVETIRQVSFEADKDYKKGERVDIRVGQITPYVLAAIEQAYNTCVINGDLQMVPIATYEETLKTLVNNENNRKFVEELYKITNVTHEKGRKQDE